MTSQYVWIGIAVGVFFAGLGIGYATFSANQPANFMHMNPQQMQQMMNNPQMMTQWHQTMMSNPQAMNTWMNTMMSDPQAMQQMHNMMASNPQHMQTMMGPMMNTMMGDPVMQQQMMNMMMGNQGMMDAMMQNQPMMNMMMGSGMNQGMMGNNMMGSGMMGGNMMMGNMMMGQPITRNSDVLSTINNIEDLLDQTSSEYNDGNQDTAFSLATTAYLENYEYIEGNIASKNLQLMQEIELMMRVDLRNMIQNGEPAEDIDAKIDSIKAELAKVKELFS
ncbi:hypothetical protein [Candidatus Nitrosotenuis aquarius]|uniref:hypothetical protein n=1 Tax=Candidatus Nitrosotenuis aquarius TaxID=1846278 RepID=UPI000C1E941C|nr:hypothetical protein [Candidatus Nitrosotenuis aquarius]